MEPKVQAAAHGILEAKEPATGPSCIPGVIVQRAQQPGQLEEVKLLHRRPLLQVGDELGTFAGEHVCYFELLYFRVDRLLESF